MIDWITNPSWEVGGFGDWVEDGSHPFVVRSSFGDPATYPERNPRSGTYFLSLVANGGIGFGRVTYTITDATLLALMANKPVTFSTYRASLLTYPGSPGETIYIRVSDTVGGIEMYNDTVVQLHPYSVWKLFQVARNIRAGASNVKFIIYCDRGASNNEFILAFDDMNVHVPLPGVHQGEGKYKLAVA
jgi:hypothetical protein